jgi:hypothetical protein
MRWSFEWNRENRGPCHNRCGTIKIPPCSEALSAVHRPKFCRTTFTSNGGVSIWVKDSWVCCKAVNYYYWLIIYCFTSRSRIFHLHEDVTITGEGLQNLGLCSALRAFEQGGIFATPAVTRDLGYFGIIQSPLTTHKLGDVEDLF